MSKKTNMMILSSGDDNTPGKKTTNQKLPKVESKQVFTCAICNAIHEQGTKLAVVLYGSIVGDNGVIAEDNIDNDGKVIAGKVYCVTCLCDAIK